jgi:gas vesicle protein
MENTKSNTTTIVSVALAGAAVGALLGILFAPDKGSATRQKLRGGAKKLAEDLTNELGLTDGHEKTLRARAKLSSNTTE